jgi:integrase
VIESQWHDLRDIARFILMGVYTGSRSGAIFTASIYAGANRSFIDLDSGLFYRLAEGATKTNKRQPPVRLPKRLLAHLHRWRDKGIIAQHVVEWEGRPVKSVKVGWKRAVELAGIRKKISPHTLRHTAATWLMQGGVDKWETAGFLGMSEQMVDRVYGHQHPDFQSNAADRITRKRAQ